MGDVDWICADYRGIMILRRDCGELFESRGEQSRVKDAGGREAQLD